MKKRVLVFGASGYGLKVMRHFDNEVEFLAFVDNAPQYNGKWGGTIV